jgi:hypothetical protein
MLLFAVLTLFSNASVSQFCQYEQRERFDSCIARSSSVYRPLMLAHNFTLTFKISNAHCPRYGVPARERFMPEALKAVGYATHAIGKWHLGACDERYIATFRGFDTYMGYLSGGQGYYNQAGDRNGTEPNTLPSCMGSACVEPPPPPPPTHTHTLAHTLAHTNLCTATWL